MIRSETRREGTVVVAVAVSLIGLLAFLALSLDGGMVLEKRRTVQGVSDSAALAAASELYARAVTEPQGVDATGAAKAIARQIATDNGYTDGVNGATVTVNIPPLSGQFKGMQFHAEVIITAPQARHISRVFGPSTNVSTTGRAVAKGTSVTTANGIIALNPTQKSSVVATGNASINVVNANVIVDSSNTAAMNNNGTGATMTATKGFALTGTPGYTGGGFTGPITSGQAPTPDPLRFLPPPPIPTTVQKVKMPINGDNPVTLKPGLYVGGISINSKATVTLSPGIYYMQGGGFSISGQGNVIGDGVLIYNAPTKKSDVVDISGTGKLTLSAMTTGPYAGLTIYQDRTSTAPVKITGDGQYNLTGGIYAAAADLTIKGNGDTSLGSQLIADTFTMTGNGVLNVVWSVDQSPKHRELYLVE
jgi:hypothetical protein